MELKLQSLDLTTFFVYASPSPPRYLDLKRAGVELMSLVHSFDSTDLRRFGSYDYTPSMNFLY